MSEEVTPAAADPQASLTVPTVASDNNTWGGIANTSWETLHSWILALAEQIRPAAPDTFDAVGTTDGIDLSWVAPVESTGTEIWSGTASGSLTLLVTLAAGIEVYAHTSLGAGTKRFYQARSLRGVLTSAFTNEINATSDSAPGQVINLQVTQGDTQLSCTYDAPVTGSPIEDYEYRLDGGAAVSWGNNSQTNVISGLTNGVSYDVEVRALNYLGTGAWSSIIAGTPVAAAIGDITIVNLTSAADTGNASVYTTASVAIPDGDIALLSFANLVGTSLSTGIVSVTTTTGLTVVQEATYQYDTGFPLTGRVSVYSASNSTGSTANGTFTITLDDIQNGLIHSVDAVTGANAGGLVVQSATTALDATGTAASMTLPGAFSHVNNATFAVIAWQGNDATSTPETGYAALMHGNHGGGNQSMTVIWREDNHATPGANWASSVPYGGIGFEFLAGNAPGGGGNPSQATIASTHLGTSGWIARGTTPEADGYAVYTTVSIGNLASAVAASAPGNVLLLAQGDHPVTSIINIPHDLTILGDYDTVTRITGHKDLLTTGWTAQTGYWEKDVAAGLGLNIDGADPSYTNNGDNPARNLWLQTVYRDGIRGYHYADNTALVAAARGNGFFLNNVTNVVQINYDPTVATTNYLSYGKGWFKAPDGVDVVLKGIAFEYDASEIKGGYNGVSPTYAIDIKDSLFAEYCDIQHGHAGGIRAKDDSMLRYCRIGDFGGNGYNLRSTGGRLIVVADCEVWGSGWAGASGDIGGGQKISFSGSPTEGNPYGYTLANALTMEPRDGNPDWAISGVLHYRCWAHDNLGSGIWYDITNWYNQIAYCLMEDNGGIGGHWELSDSNWIHHCHIARCGAGKGYDSSQGGIMVANSGGGGTTGNQRLIIEDNKVTDCPKGIVVFWNGDRGDPHVLKNVIVQNNNVLVTSDPLALLNPYTGAIINFTPEGAHGNSTGAGANLNDNLVYVGNYYAMPTLRFKWESIKTEAQWQAIHPGDSTGTPAGGVPAAVDVGLIVPV